MSRVSIVLACGAPCGHGATSCSCSNVDRFRRDQQSIREVLEIEREAKEASLRRDPEFPQKMLADDYVAISPLGQITTKKEAISARKSGQLRYDTIDISDIVVRLYGDTAIVTARADVKGHQLGEDFSGPYRYTRVWVRKAGHWQAVSYQATVTQ